MSMQTLPSQMCTVKDHPITSHDVVDFRDAAVQLSPALLADVASCVDSAAALHGFVHRIDEAMEATKACRDQTLSEVWQEIQG